MSEVNGANRVALVTGASRGIGAAIAQELAARGYRVIGTATTEAGAEKISAALAAYAGCRGAALDVNDAAAAESLIDAIVKEHGALHVLVNNAGITRDQLAMRMKDDDWDAVLDTTLNAVFRMSRAVMRPMMKQRYGRIVNMSSISGVGGNAGQANYAASKAGVIGLTKTIARELAARGVTANAVAPGFISTDMTDALSEKQCEAIGEQIPMKRFGTVDDVAHLVGFLASEESGYITGQVICIDGGLAL